jgi:hypothetical protein
MKRILAALLIMTAVLMSACGARTTPPEDTGSAPPSPPATSSATPSGKPGETESPSPSASPETPDEEDESPVGAVYTDTITIEGMPETVSYARVKGSFGYAIPIDVDRFEFIPAEGKDYFICALNEHVWMSIEHATPATVEEMREKLPEWPEEAVVSENDVTITENKYPARHVHVLYGTSYDSTVMDYYIVEDGAGGCYVITHCYFLEGAEGWGARLYYMTEDFVIEKA